MDQSLWLIFLKEMDGFDLAMRLAEHVTNFVVGVGVHELLISWKYSNGTCRDYHN